uniref:Cytochrome c domain-containing protein n=1 Tax=Myotis myotis TaxID=51298 RepID=A0A7J7RMK8_MYOMY|nr:hypothetical protein mMyoMyo1_010260 [Myotis myotis]
MAGWSERHVCWPQADPQPCSAHGGQYRIAWEADAVPGRKLFQCKRWLLHSQDYSLVIVSVCMPCHTVTRLGNIFLLFPSMEGSAAQPVRTALPCHADLCLWGCGWSPLAFARGRDRWFYGRCSLDWITLLVCDDR